MDLNAATKPIMWCSHSHSHTHWLESTNREKPLKKIEFKFSLMQLHLLQSTSIRIGRNIKSNHIHRQRRTTEMERDREK